MIKVLPGDCFDVIRTLADCSIDAVCTDPPYGLEFMSVAWDSFSDPKGAPRVRNEWEDFGSREHPRNASAAARTAGKKSLAFYAFSLQWATEVLRVLKPGGHLVAFGGTRTYHRLACAIEDAGFEIRDQLQWIYGSGFPKSHDVSKGIDKAAGAKREVVGSKIGQPGYSLNQCADPGGVAMEGNVDGSLRNPAAECAITAPSTDAARQWEGWGTALKPAHEPICLARKPLSEATVAANVLRWGTGALNIDGCRIETGDKPYSYPNGRGGEGWHGRESLGANLDVPVSGSPLGRWPANIIHDGSQEVLDLFPESSITGLRKQADRQQQATVSTPFTRGKDAPEYTDNGSAARFFFQANPSEDELLFCRAKAILASWNSDLANTADDNSTLSSELVGFALRDVAILASQGTKKSFPVLSMSATPPELRRISETLIMAILSSGNEYWRAPPLERRFPNGTLASSVATRLLTDTMRITISHWKSDGSAAAVTFDIMPLNSAHGGLGSCARFRYHAKAGANDRIGSKHPTVKPIALMRWLVRLITPPGGTVLDPFAGTGTTGQAAIEEGFNVILIEREAEYVADIARRMEHVQKSQRERRQTIAMAHVETAGPLFEAAE